MTTDKKREKPDTITEGGEGPHFWEIPPPTPGELLDELSRAFNEIRPVEGDRAAYIHALWFISALLMYPGYSEDGVRRKTGYGKTARPVWAGMISRECGSWLMRLAAALEELDAGIVWPTLQPAPISHRKPSPSYIRYRRACVAAGVKALIRSGVARMDAAKRAIREVKSIAGTSPETVLSWMDEFGKKRRANTPGASLYKTINLVDLSKCRGRVEHRRAAAQCFWNANRPLVY
jgi:hypothetical protein